MASYRKESLINRKFYYIQEIIRMKVFRHPLAIMYLIFIVLVVAGLIFLFNVFDLFVRDSTVVIPKPASTDYTRWELPKGAKARLGKGQIRDIKFAPDGTRFAVATTIGVWMYDAKTGAEISLLSGDRHDYNGIAFSYDGSTLSGVNADGEISRWDVSIGELHTMLKSDTVGYLYKVDFSEDSTKLAIVSIHNDIEKINVWNLDKGNSPTFTNLDVGKEDGLSPTIALSPDNRFLATSKEEKADRYPIHVWNTDSGERLFTLERDEHSRTKVLAFSPDGKTLVSCDYDTIFLWDLHTKTVRTTFKTDWGLSALAFSPNGKLLASGDDDGLVILWNATVQQKGFAGKIGQNLSSLKLKKHREEIVSMAFSPDGKMLLSGSKDGTIRAWDTTTGQQHYICPGHVSEVSDIAVSAEDNTLISLHTQENKLIKWDITTGHPFSSTFFTLKGPETISQNANKFVVNTFGFKHRIQLWDTAKIRLKYNLNGHGYPSEFWRLVNAFSPDENMVAVTTSRYQTGTIYLWDIANPSKSLLGRIFNPKSIQPKYTFQGNQQEVTALAFSPDGKILASSGEGLDINLWNTESGSKLLTLTGDRSSIDNLVFSPDGNMLASAYYSTVYLWDLTDLTTGNLVRKIETHSGAQTLLFSPDGRHLVSGGWDGKIRLIDSDSGQVLSTHTGHADGISRKISKLVFLEDGKTLASACEDGTILLWDWDRITNRDR
ncbi:hypothetical protein F4X73_08605 [Candidatus Poribacteria bacterium]|nr:hypothetical protein [Candidatus Poribacteria bacterium]